MRVRLNQEKLLDVLSHSRLSQNHWAIKLGLSRGHLSDLANGRHPYPSPKTREKLLEGFGLTFEELFHVETDSREWSHASSASFQAALADRYIVDEEIGQGGMGTVYLARDVKHGRRVAIKVVSPEAVSGVGVEQFLKEIRKTAQLEHPHVLTLLDSGEAAGYPYYVMPYIRGGSLRDLLEKKQRLSLRETIDIVGGVAAALRHAHENRVVHCDVKPENILLSDGHAYLADFGVARAVHAEARAWKRRGEIDSSAGTPAYVSPEQASGDPDLDGKTDVYSLGCVVYEMLSGVTPFDGTTTMEVVSRRFTATAPNLREAAPQIPTGVAAVVRRAMAREARERFRSATDFVNALGEAAEHAPGIMVEKFHLIIGRVARSVATIVPALKGMPIVANVIQDLTYAVRSLGRRPAQTLVLILTLALGIGVNAAMFSIVSTVLLRPLPYPQPDRIMALWESRRDAPRDIAVTYPNFVDMRDNTEQFAHVAAYFGGTMAGTVSGGDGPVRASFTYVSEHFFDVLGVSPKMGGAFPPDESTAFGMTNVVLGDGLWRSNFGGDPNILGRVISVDGRQAAVVGVMPVGFAFPRGLSAWVVQDMDPLFGPSRTAHNLRVIARLEPGSSFETARAEMSVLATTLATSYPAEIDEAFDIAVVPLHQELAGDATSSLLLLTVVVGVVLLIACGNITSILLSQALARNKEVAIRRAVGAGSARLARQMLTESLFLGVVGAAAGLTMAFASMKLLNTVVPRQFLHSGDLSLDWRVMSFTLGLGVFTGLLFGILPAWRLSRYEPADVLRTDGSEVVQGGRRRRIGGLFVIPQYAFSLAALIVAGLILKSLFVLSSVDPGFEPEARVTMELNLPYSSPSPYGDREYAAQFYRTLLDRVGALPGVRSATLDLSPPLSSRSFLNGGVQRGEEEPNMPRWDKNADWRPVGAGYFGTIGIPLLRGRDFSESDGENAVPVTIVNESLARLLWGDQDPLGRRLRLSSLDNNRPEALRELTVIGLAPDVHHRSLEREPRAAVYAPIFQHLDRVRSMHLVIAVTGPVNAYPGPLLDIVRGIDPDIPPGRVETMEGWVKESISEPRFRAGLLSAFGGIALLLSLLGVYGVLSYSVTQRRREVSVRLALGAQRRDILRLLTGEGLRFVLIGQVVGLAAAFGLTRLVEGLLFGVSATDARVFWGASLLLALVVLLTCYIPARRAGRVEPQEVLRG